MKRAFILIMFIVCILLTGCSNDKYFVCKIDLDNEIDEYHLDAIYKVYYKNSYVIKIEKEEIYITQNKDTLNYFNEYKNLEYLNLNNLYGGITYKVDASQDKVKLNATIDMNLVDINKMIKNNKI